MSQMQTVIEAAAEELGISKDDLMVQGLRRFLERRLYEAQAQIFQIAGSYGVSGVEEMEARYRQGALDEAASWRDLQRLDHLEYKRDRLLQQLRQRDQSGGKLPQ